MRVGRFRDSLSCHRYRCRHPLHRPRRLAVPGGPILPLRHLLRSCGPPLPPCPGRNRILVRVLAISKKGHSLPAVSIDSSSVKTTMGIRRRPKNRDLVQLVSGCLTVL
jgi:hypothetical protein